MHIHQRIESTLRFEVEGVSLLGGSKYELYLKQPFGVFYQFTPEIINENTFDVTIPYEAAMELTTGNEVHRHCKRRQRLAGDDRRRNSAKPHRGKRPFRRHVRRRYPDGRKQ